MPRRPAADRPPPDDDALEAVWGREASERAAPVPRPSVSPPGGPGAPARPDRVAMTPGVVALVVLVALVVVTVVVVVTRGDPAQRPQAAGPERPAAPVTTAASPPWEPIWTAAVRCGDEATADGVTTRCAVAVDDERAYVLDERSGPAAGPDEATVVALDVVDGRQAWATALPGASAVERLPAVLAVRTGGRTQGVDPADGTVLWTVPALVVAELGRDHVLVDDTSDGPDNLDLTRMSVIDAVTGAVVLSRVDLAADLHIHPCAAAGLVLVSQGGRLTAHDIVDGSERWSVPSAHHDASDPLVCGPDVVVGLQGGGLAARDTRTGEVVGSMVLDAPADDGPAMVLAVVAGTVVVALPGSLQGFAADATLVRRWLAPLPDRRVRVVVEPAAAGVAFAVLDDRAGWYGPDGAGGAQVPLPVGAAVVIDSERLVAWRRDEVLVAPAADLSRTVRRPVTGVELAAPGSRHVAVVAGGEVRVYPYDP